jgi:hypothetical protein
VLEGENSAHAIFELNPLKEYLVDPRCQNTLEFDDVALD